MAEQTAAARLLSVLDAFDERHPRLSLTEISRRAGLSLTTTHRLVGELTRWGGLSRDDSGEYCLGLRIFELGAIAPEGLHLRELATPSLGDLRLATRANVHLAVPEGRDVVYVESLRASDGAEVLSRVGGRWPMQVCATGLVLLANAEPALQEQVLAAPLRVVASGSFTDPARLRRYLGEVRRSGVAVIENGITEGVMAIGVPVRGARDKVVAGLSVTVPTGTQPHTLVPALRTAARAVSRQLGAPSAAADRLELRRVTSFSPPPAS